MILKTSILHFEKKYFEKKQMNNFKTLEDCYRFQPSTRVNLDFHDTV
jgi:hypothetical protein